jgi:hypothetical protein
MEIRQARAAELPHIQARLEAENSEDIGIDTARIFVAVEDGQILGVLAARMVWQLQPLVIFPEVRNKAKRRRAGLGMFRAAQEWLGSRSLNRTGIHWFFAVTRSRPCMGWLKSLGMLRQYRGTAHFLKYL